MIAEHARLMKPPEAKPMSMEEYEDAKDIIRKMNLPDVKI